MKLHYSECRGRSLFNKSPHALQAIPEAIQVSLRDVFLQGVWCQKFNTAHLQSSGNPPCRGCLKWVHLPLHVPCILPPLLSPLLLPHSCPSPNQSLFPVQVCYCVYRALLNVSPLRLNFIILIMNIKALSPFPLKFKHIN